MKKSAAILLIIAALVIGVVIGVKLGRNDAIRNARLVEDNGDTYVIGYSSRLDTGDSYEELHEYVR